MKRLLSQTLDNAPKRPKLILSSVPLAGDLINIILSLAWTSSNHRSLALICRRFYYTLFGSEELNIRSLLLRKYHLRYMLQFPTTLDIQCSSFGNSPMNTRETGNSRLDYVASAHALYIPCVAVYNLLAEKLDRKMMFVHILGTLWKMKLSFEIGSRLLPTHLLLLRIVDYEGVKFSPSSFIAAIRLLHECNVQRHCDWYLFLRSELDVLYRFEDECPEEYWPDVLKQVSAASAKGSSYIVKIFRLICIVFKSTPSMRSYLLDGLSRQDYLAYDKMLYNSDWVVEQPLELVAACLLNDGFYSSQKRQNKKHSIQTTYLWRLHAFLRDNPNIQTIPKHILLWISKSYIQHEDICWPSICAHQALNGTKVIIQLLGAARAEELGVVTTELIQPM